MKSLLKLILSAALLFAVPVASYALDPHDSQISTVTAYSTTTTATPQTVTIATLTTHAVNSGTNSYFLKAIINYEVPSGSAVSFQIANDGTAIASTVTAVSNSGQLVLEAEVEGIAASKAITIQAVGKTTGTPIAVSKAVLTILGLAGATQ